MCIELTIKYSEAEYKAAIKEKLAVMPNKSIHTYLPTGILLIVVAVLCYFNFIFNWWGIATVVILSIYAIPCLLGDFLMPSIALAFAKKKKLQDTYHFKIDKDKIERNSEKGVMTTKWEDLSSVDFFPKNVFFNLPKGSMLIPNSYLSSAELEVLKSYAART
jgi:hypothetical protein